MRLLLVEDEVGLARHLKKGLAEEGYATDHAGTCRQALYLLREVEYDVIVLDLNLPDGSGLDVLGQLRRWHLTTPVLVLTARDRLEEKIHGLDSGADDYLTKPFEFVELLARLRTLLRRRQAPPVDRLQVADVVLDRTRRVVERAGAPVELTTREFALLEYLMLHAGAPVDRTTIAEHVWDLGYEARSNTIDVLIGRLRAKLEGDSGPRLIRTVKGVGYVLGGSGVDA